MLEFWKFFFAFRLVQGKLCGRWCVVRADLFILLSDQRYRVGCSRTWSFILKVSKCNTGWPLRSLG